MGAVIIVLGIPPLLFYAFRKPSWDQRDKTQSATEGESRA